MDKSIRNRRDFLKTTAAIGAVTPYYFSTQRSLADQLKTKNERPTVALIGCGMIAGGSMGHAKPYVDLVALVDVDSRQRERYATQFTDGKAENFSDYREVLGRDDIDLIYVATPDHWHAKILIESMLAGKDVYCEKPMTLTVDEAKLVRTVHEQTGRVVQIGTQQRTSFDYFTKVIAMVAEDRLGKIHRIEVGLDGGRQCGPIPIGTPHEELDWNAWLGPTPDVPFRSGGAVYPLEDGKMHYASNCHGNFRWWYEYSAGKLTDWGAHHVDIAAWALRTNGQTDGPVSIEGEATHPVEFVDGVPQQRDRYNTATSFELTARYPGGTEMVITSKGNYVLIEGDKGRLRVNRNRLTGRPVEDLEQNPLPEGAIANAYRDFPMIDNDRPGHWANLVHCTRERVQPISDVPSHIEALNVCHIAAICARLGRKLEWDSTKEEFVNDEVANSMLSRPYREEFAIEM